MSDWTDQFKRPSEVTDVEIAFPASAPKYMPTLDQCTTYLTALGAEEGKWREFQRTWFYEGLPPEFAVGLRTIDGEVIDGNKAFRHLKVIQGSFAPQHEHKEAAVAVLAHMWFDDYAFEGFDVEKEEPSSAE
jgi:hypothetical protein